MIALVIHVYIRIGAEKVILEQNQGSPGHEKKHHILNLERPPYQIHQRQRECRNADPIEVQQKRLKQTHLKTAVGLFY